MGFVELGSWLSSELSRILHLVEVEDEFEFFACEID